MDIVQESLAQKYITNALRDHPKLVRLRVASLTKISTSDTELQNHILTDTKNLMYLTKIGLDLTVLKEFCEFLVVIYVLPTLMRIVPFHLLTDPSGVRRIQASSAPKTPFEQWQWQLQCEWRLKSLKSRLKVE